jgi:hypothetical protein
MKPGAGQGITDCQIENQVVSSPLRIKRPHGLKIISVFNTGVGQWKCQVQPEKEKCEIKP